MKILLTLILVLAVTVVFAQETKQKQPQKQKTEQTVKKAQPKTDYVYICNGSKSEKYHKTSNCRGLSRCSTATQKISKADAQKKGRTPCKICYK